MVRFGDARLGDDLSGVDVARRQVGQLVDAGEASLEKNKPTNKKKQLNIVGRWSVEDPTRNEVGGGGWQIR